MKLGKIIQILPESWLFLNYGDVVQAIENSERYLRTHQCFQGVEEHIEEFVRQWVICRLIDGYGYPSAWIESGRLVIEQFIPIGSRYGQADIALRHPNGRPFLLIETKPKGISEQAFLAAIGQLESYLSASHTAMLGLVTDGQRTKVLCKQFNPPDFITRADIPTFAEALREGLTHPDDPSANIIGASSTPDVDLETEEDWDGTCYIPSVDEYIEGFQLIDAHITDLQRALLRAHYYAVHRTATATELALAVGARSFRTTNAQYGRLAGKLIDVMNWRYKQVSVNLSILVTFISPKQSSKGQWLLEMLPEVAEAIEHLHWV